jgi:hypothetical protein
MADEETAAPPRPTSRMSGIIWGPPKSGKTTFAATSPGHKYVINLDPDGWQAIGYRDDVTVWDYSDQPSEDIVRVMTTKIGTKIEQSGAQPGDTLLFDSASSFYQAAFNTAVSKGIGKSNKFTPTIEEPGQSAYGARTQYLIQATGVILRATRKMGMHCWIIGHEDTATTNDKGEFLYISIMMSEKAVNQTSLQISEVWHFSDPGTGNKRRIAVRPCRGHKPMGSRMFKQDGAAEFEFKYNIDKPDAGQETIAKWWDAYIAGGMKKLELPE